MLCYLLYENEFFYLKLGYTSLIVNCPVTCLGVIRFIQCPTVENTVLSVDVDFKEIVVLL